MSTGEQLPAERQPGQDPTALAGLYVAKQWADVDPEVFKAAMEALEPSLRREHKERLSRMHLQQQERAAQVLMQQRAARDKHRLVQLVCGTVLALGMLSGGIYVAPHSWWLSLLLCGPSLLALLKVFVLNRSDEGDMAAVSGAFAKVLKASGQAPPPPPPGAV
jgi:hypothetical protein